VQQGALAGLFTLVMQSASIGGNSPDLPIERGPTCLKALKIILDWRARRG